MTAPWPIRLLADDLTGALDSAAAFGPGVPVQLDWPALGVEDHAPVSVVATATRDIAPVAVPAALAPSLPWLAGAGLAFKKVDSLLRGNTLAELRTLAASGHYARVVFAPALPAQGRFMLNGHLAVVPPGGTLGPDHVRSQDLRATLQRDGWPAACALEVPDVRSDADLDALAQATAVRTLWCGSAGLAAALARRWRSQLHSSTVSVASPARGTGPVWVIGASHQTIARQQWAQAVAAYPQATTVRHGDPAALDAALAQMAQGSTPLALIDLSPLAPLHALESATLLQAQAVRLARLPRPGRLLVLGGDTARALATATGVQHLRTGHPLRPGWGQAQWQGGHWDGVWMDCRSGAFGDDQDLLTAITACL
jgi:uncharacterized protein YgbK (DUF1537 family)